MHQKGGDVPLIGVLGLGHVGLPTALGFAELGWDVVGADSDQDKADQLAQGKLTFWEPDLAETLRTHLGSGRFRIARDVPSVIRDSTILFVCVGTPQRENGAADLSQVERVARVIAEHLNGFKLIVEKSTTPISTAEHLKRTIARHARTDHNFEVAVNPEFLREGTALFDFLNPDRIVLGVESEEARDLLLKIYRPLLDGDVADDANVDVDQEIPSGLASASAKGRVVVTDLNTAELIKHAANAFLAMKVSFINLVADVCDAASADVDVIAKALGIDPRIGPHFLRAGVGFGGYCLPKDLTAFARIGEEHGVDAALLTAVSDINDNRVEVFLSKVRRALWVLEGKTFAVWGLAFKPGTDDIREAPSLKIVSRLLNEGGCLRLYDPMAIPETRMQFPEIPGRLLYCSSAAEAAQGADAVLLITEWPEFREVDLTDLRERMTLPIVVDGRNFLDPIRVREQGFEYHGMGR